VQAFYPPEGPGQQLRDAPAAGIAPNLFYRWKEEAEQGAKATLGGEALPRGSRADPTYDEQT
jgi:hypothetical protein